MHKIAWRISLILGILAVSVGVLLVRPHYQQARCREALKLLGNAIRTYKVDHEERLPNSLTVLSNELSNPAFLICPGTGHTPASFLNSDSWADYTLVDWPALLGTNSVPSTYPIAYDRSLTNHGGRGVNVLTADGFVHWDPNAQGLKKFVAQHPNFKLSIP